MTEQTPPRAHAAATGAARPAHPAQSARKAAVWASLWGTLVITGYIAATAAEEPAPVSVAPEATSPSATEAPAQRATPRTQTNAPRARQPVTRSRGS